MYVNLPGGARAWSKDMVVWSPVNKQFERITKTYSEDGKVESQRIHVR